VCVVGAGGIGKTAVAVAVAHYVRVRLAFPDGVFTVDARGLGSVLQLCFAIAAALRLPNVATASDLQIKEEVTGQGAPCQAEHPKVALAAELPSVGAPRISLGPFLQVGLPSLPTPPQLSHPPVHDPTTHRPSSCCTPPARDPSPPHTALHSLPSPSLSCSALW
jgi:hypothetical protein